jgi:MFS family permease
MMSVSSIVASDLVPLKKRGLIQGVANLFYGLGAGIGGPLGGFLSDRVGWRAAFLIQVPVVCLSITLVSFLLYYRVPGQDESKKPSLSRIDWAGSFTLIVAVATLLLAMSFKTNELKAWSDATVWAPLIVSVIFLALFIYVEARISKEPVMPIRLVTQKSPLANLGVNFFNSACAFVMLYFYVRCTSRTPHS